MNYYPHHIGDFNNATRHLNRIERSIYRDMIELYYDTEQSLTRDVPTLCRRLIAKSDEEVTAVQQVLNEFFTKTEQGWYHDRCEREIQEFQTTRCAKSSAGKASAAKREVERLKRINNLNISSTPVEIRCGSVGSSVQQTSNQEPVTSNQEPVTSNQTLNQEQPPAVAIATAPKKTSDKKDEPNPLNLETWQAYKRAYADRYTVEPVRDAAVNAKIKSIVRGLGDEAPAVAAFFVSHNGSRYVSAMHQIGLLSADYAKLRTEWATNTHMTQTKALQADKTATNFDAFAPLIAAAREREQAERIENAK